MIGLILPNLTAGNHRVTSPQEHHHNCIAFAVHEESLILWPDDDGHWPATVTRCENIDAFIEFFVALKFEEVPLTQVGYEPGYEKVAIFAKEGKPRHAARQLTTGEWKSKLGRLVDITHSDLHGLEGGEYGYVVRLMRRLNTGKPPILPTLSPPRPLIIRP